MWHNTGPGWFKKGIPDTVYSPSMWREWMKDFHGVIILFYKILDCMQDHQTQTSIKTKFMQLKIESYYTILATSV